MPIRQNQNCVENMHSVLTAANDVPVRKILLCQNLPVHLWQENIAVGESKSSSSAFHGKLHNRVQRIKCQTASQSMTHWWLFTMAILNPSRGKNLLPSWYQMQPRCQYERHCRSFFPSSQQVQCIFILSFKSFNILVLRGLMAFLLVEG